MNSDILQGNWKQLKGQLKKEFGELSDDDWMQAEGDTERLVGLIQEKYGVTKDSAEKKLDQFMNNAKTDDA